MAQTSPTPLRFTSHKSLADRLVLSTLTGRPIRVSSIRPSSHSHPGLAPHEISLIRLLDSLTNGSEVEFSYTGTTFVYKPGLIVGSANGYGAQGGVVRHELPRENTRGISYFLIPICMLAPFAKAPVNVIFSGPGVITSATTVGDPSVDTVRTAILPLYARFGVQLNIELRILRRSNPGPGGKGGAGEVQLVFGHQVRLPKTLHLLNAGRIKKIRGVAYSTGVAAANNARMIEAARGVLNSFCPDTYVFSDVASAPWVSEDGPGTGPKGKEAKKKKTGVGFGLSLVAESSTNCLVSADVASPADGGVTAEDIGKQCAYQLLEEVSRGGCVSKLAAPTVLMLMAMGSEDVGRVLLGKDVLGSEELVRLARDLSAFGMSQWGIRDLKEEEATGEVVVSVVGRGVGNVGRKIA